MPDLPPTGTPPHQEPAFLAGGSEMARRIRAHDWAATSLGPPPTWPQTLRTVIRLMLNTAAPIFVFWGPDHLCFYNDAFAPSIGRNRHPACLGQPGRQVWAEMWDVIGPQVEMVMAGGGATWHENQRVPIFRDGALEDAYWTYGHSPIDDDAAPSGVAGVLVIVTETTGQVLAERRQAARADAAAAERARLAELFEATPSFMALLDGPEHRIMLANPAAHRFVGRRDLIGRPVAEALPESLAQGFVALLDEVYRTGRPYAATGARYVAAPDLGPPEEKYTDFIYQPIFGEHGRPTGIFVEGADTTARTAAEAQWRRTADLLRVIIEATPSVIYAKDRDGRMQLANTAALALIGRPWEEVRDRTDREVLADPAHAEAVMANDERVMHTGQTMKLEEWVGTAGQAPRLFLSTKSPVRDPSGAVTGLVGVSVDITERKALEKALQDLNDHLAAEVAQRTAERDSVWRYSLDLILVIDHAGTILATNPAWEATLGYTPAELAGSSVYDFVHQPHHEATAANLRQLRDGPIRQHENRYRHKDGSLRWISWTAVTQGQQVYCVGRDVTEAKRQADELARTAEALRQSHKMETVGVLAGGLAHDINNLLTGISGSLELLARRIGQGRVNELDRYVDVAQRAAARAAALTHRLLAFSRRQTLDPTPTDMNRLIRDMLDLVRRTVGPSVDVTLSPAPGLWTVLVDRNQLENALLNLCLNGRDAMPGGGRIVIATENHEFDEAAARDRDLPPGRYASLCVTDFGTGMTEEVVQRAFDPFFTTKPLGSGTGLGLSMIYGFIRQSGGQAKIYSRPGEGTSVCLFLPWHDGAAAEEALGAETAPGRAGAGETVLVVDDEPSVRILVREVLEDLGYAALVAGDAASALAALDGARRVDLLVTDVGLPGGMNGRQLADAARGLRPGLKVLFITGYAETAVMGGGQLAAGMHILTKPFALDVLGGRIKDIICGH